MRIGQLAVLPRVRGLSRRDVRSAGSSCPQRRAVPGDGAMTCSHCGSDNPAGKRFCGDCGSVLENRCPHCGADNPPNKRFCGDCGISFAAQPAHAGDTAEARKVVTILFADLAGSTALHARLDPESVRAFMERYYAGMRAV